MILEHSVCGGVKELVGLAVSQGGQGVLAPKETSGARSTEVPRSPAPVTPPLVARHPRLPPAPLFRLLLLLLHRPSAAPASMRLRSTSVPAAVDQLQRQRSHHCVHTLPKELLRTHEEFEDGKDALSPDS